MRRISLLFLLLLAINFYVKSQTSIASETFENTAPLFTVSGGAYYSGNSGTGDRVASSPFAIQGTYAFGVTNTTATLTSSAINSSGYTNISMTLRLASFSMNSSSNGADGTDLVRVDVSPDGGTNWYSTVSVAGNANAYWSYAGGTGNASTAYDGDANVVAFAPTSGGNRTTDGYSKITITGLPSATSMKLRIYLINNSANERWVIDSLSVKGYSGNTPPALSPDVTSNDVDNNIDITFTDDATWRAAVTAVKIGTTALTVSTDYELTSGNLRLKPSGLNTLLTTAGSKSVSVEATGYTPASATQVINAGAPTKLGMKTQPAAPATNGGALATQPAVYIQDQYGNTTTSTDNVSAAVGAGTWTLGGTTTVAATSGTATYSGLTATSSSAVTGATISFTSGSLTGITSGTFNIPAPAPVITITGSLSNFGSTCANVPSTEQSYSVSGANMTANLVITAPTHFQISETSGSGFTTSITLVQSGGSVPSTTIYARFVPTSSGNKSGNITHTTTGGTTQNQPVAGTGQTVPYVTTTAISNIGYNTATGGGNVTSTGFSTVTANGVCWNTSGSPTVTDSHTDEASGAGIYTSYLTGLTAATLYYVKSYATNGCGTSYGTEVSFTTLTTPVSVPYSQDFEGTYSDWSFGASGTNKWAVGSATNNGGSKAMYISNDAGTSNAYTLTSAQAGTDATLRVDLTGLTSASLGFDWKANGEEISGTYYDYGEVYINTGSSDVLLSGANEFFGTTTFANKHLSLTPYVGGVVAIKFRWVNDNTTGNQPPFAVDNVTIGNSDVPAVTTTSASSVTYNSASTGGNISSDGGATVTARGVCYGTSHNPSLSGNYTSDGTGTGSFTSSLSGLTDNTTYYVRAYATNSTGTAYGSEISFTTSPVSAPTANEGTALSTSQFTASWNSVAGAVNGYKIDVSSTDFSTSNITEVFSSIGGGTTSSYLTRSWTGVGGIAWTAYKARIDQVVYTGNEAIALQDASGAYIISDAIQGNPASISFDVKQVFSGSGGNVILSILHGSGYGTTTTIGTYSYTTTASTVNAAVSGITGPYKIRIDNGNTSARPCIDNLVFPKESFTTVGSYYDYSVADTTQVITGLSAGNNYYYRVRALGSNGASVNSNTVNVFLAAYASTFTETGNWNASEYWSNGIPASYTDVTIDGYATINENAACNKLTVLPGRSVTLDNGYTLTVGDSMVLKSDGSGYASLIDFGTLSCTSSKVVIENFIPGSGRGDTIWHFYSSPVAAATADVFSYFYVDSWLESTNTWNPLTTGNPLEVGRGYACFYTGNISQRPDIKIFFHGQPNTGNYNPTLSYSNYAGNADDNWNLIGNPYPSAFDLYSFTGNSNTESSVSYWVATAGSNYRGQFATYNFSSNIGNNGGQRYVPAMQGFFIKATGSSPSFSMTNAQRAVSSQAFYKSNDDHPNLLSLTAGNSEFRDETIIACLDNATMNYEDVFDAAKLFSSYNNLPAFYSTTPDHVNTAINCIPPLVVNQTVTVPLSFRISDNGNYTVKANHLNSFDNDVVITLEDLITQSTTDLRTQPEYSFSYNTGERNDRFLVHFTKQNLGITDNNSEPVIYCWNNQVHVSNNSGRQMSIAVINMLGQEVLNMQSGTNSVIDLNPQPKGYYLIKVVTGVNSVVRKIYTE